MRSRTVRRAVAILVAATSLAGLGLTTGDCPAEAIVQATVMVETQLGDFTIEVCVTHCEIAREHEYTLAVTNDDLQCPIQSFGLRPMLGVEAELEPSPMWQPVNEAPEWWMWDGPPWQAIEEGSSREFSFRVPDSTHVPSLAGAVFISPASSCGGNALGFEVALVESSSLGMALTTSSGPNVNLTTHGIISHDEIWRDEIHIIGDIWVGHGVTLTIEPGTKVLVAAHSDAANLFTDPFDLKQGICWDETAEEEGGIHVGEPYYDEGNHIQIRIDGTLHAVGTPDQLITITSDAEDPGWYDWRALRFAKGELAYAVVEYYRHLGPGEGTVVRHCILRHIGGCALCSGERHGYTVENTRIYDTGHELIDLHGPADFVIRNCELGPNRIQPNPGGIIDVGGEGIIIDNCVPVIVGNTIKECDSGVVFISDLSVELDNYVAELCQSNTFRDNGWDIRKVTDEGPMLELSCKTSDSEQDGGSSGGWKQGGQSDM